MNLTERTLKRFEDVTGFAGTTSGIPAAEIIAIVMPDVEKGSLRPPAVNLAVRSALSVLVPNPTNITAVELIDLGFVAGFCTASAFEWSSDRLRVVQ